jgi:hypothetical protein
MEYQLYVNSLDTGHLEAMLRIDLWCVAVQPVLHLVRISALPARLSARESVARAVGAGLLLSSCPATSRSCQNVAVIAQIYRLSVSVDSSGYRSDIGQVSGRLGCCSGVPLLRRHSRDETQTTCLSGPYGSSGAVGGDSSAASKPTRTSQHRSPGSGRTRGYAVNRCVNGEAERRSENPRVKCPIHLPSSSWR